MTDSSTDLRSLDLCAIGLGQGGCNLAAEWRRRGYRTIVCNTARADLQSLSRSEDLDVPLEEQLFIGLEGHDGAGRDPVYGRACVVEHAERIREAVKERLKGADALLIFAGLGGGTGSACDELIDTLAPLDIPMLCISTLPAHSESGITKVNAVRTANELVQRSLHGRIFIDNERLLQEHQDVGMGKFYPTVNAAALSSLDAINRMNGKEGWYSIKSFDGEDLRKVLLSGGVLNAHSVVLEGEISADSLVAAARLCVDGGNYFAQGSRLDGCPYLAVVITGPEEVLGSFSAEAFDAAVAALKDTTGGGAVYEGIYIATDDDNVKVHVLSSSLSLPERLTTLLSEAHEEGSELARKISEELPSLETSSLDGMDLFRAPRRQPVDEDKPVPPKPRPLSEQLRASFPAASTTGAAIRDGGPAPLAMSIPLPAEKGNAKKGANDVVHNAKKESILSEEDYSEGSSDSDENFDAGLVANISPDGGGFSPRVGTGQYDENEEVERTSTAELSDVQPKMQAGGDVKLGLVQEAHLGQGPRVGTGAYQEGEEDGLEPTQMLHEKEFGGGLSQLAKAKDPSLLPPPMGDDDVDNVFEGEVTDQRDVPQTPSVIEREAAGFELKAVMTNQINDADIVGELPSRAIHPEEITTAAPLNPEADLLLSSVLAHSGDDLLAVYEDLIDRFRQAPDKRGRERVARRLVDDAKKPDVEMRALAVWAMNRLEQGGFKRALKKASNDENAEIRRLAKDGLARLKSRKKAAQG